MGWTAAGLGQVMWKMVVGVGKAGVVRSLGGRPGNNSVIKSLLVICAVTSCVFSDFAEVAGDRTFTKVYEPIQGTVACFKRLNGTSEIGCRSSTNGDVGVLHVIEDSESLQWVLKEGPHAPYIVLLYVNSFTRENLLQFRNSGRVNGVLLLPEKQGQVSAFSTDSSCPNNQFGAYNTSSPAYCEKWNKPGNSLLFEKFDFPIFFVKNETDAQTLLNCYESSNKPVNGTPRGWPLCAGQLKSFMMAAKDTPTCLRRSSVFSINPGTTKVCDPLGDQNVWATLLPQNSSDQDENTTTTTVAAPKSALVLAARLDGASLFDEISPSADSSLTGLVTLLTVVKQLGSIKDRIGISPDSVVNSVYFMVFNGEAFGYIGSSRMAYDMSRDQFPLKLEEIRHFLEVNQLAPRSQSQNYFLHQSNKQSKELNDILVEQANKLKISLNSVDDPKLGVPPSSLHSFLRERSDLSGVVLTNHRESYENPFYNSIFDTKENVKYDHTDKNANLQQQLASLAATITNTVIKLLNSTSDISVSPDVDTVNELLYCYLETSNCSTFRAIYGDAHSPVEPYPTYVGVATYVNTLTQITKYIMVSYLGEPVENATSEDTCFGRNSDTDTPAGRRPRFFINGTCFDCPQINMTEARSPAFIIPNYDWSSGRYSTWTESVWQKFSVRIFLKPSLAQEIVTLISGILLVVVSFAVVRFVNTKSDFMFPSRTDALVC